MDWSFVNEISIHLTRGLPAFVAALVVLVAARILFRLTTTFRASDDIVAAENPAVALVLGSYLLGVAIALVGAIMTRGEDNAVVAMSKIAIEGLLAIGLLRVALWVNDRFVLHRFCITQEVQRDRNVGAGFCVAGSCIACGLILNGALTGISKNFAFGLLDIAIYWLLGQVVLVIGAFVYSRMARYDIHELIENDDNVAVGIRFGAFLLCLGFVVRASIVHAGHDPLLVELTRSLLLALVGIPGLLAIQLITHRLLAVQLAIEDEVEMHGNVAVSSAAAGAMLAITLLLTSILQR